MITARINSSKKTFQEILFDGGLVAQIWGTVTKVEPPYNEGDTYFVAINGTDTFIHPDEVIDKADKEID